MTWNTDGFPGSVLAPQGGIHALPPDEFPLDQLDALRLMVVR